MMPTVQIVSDVAQFAALETEWNALAERCATPLVRHEWFAAAVAAHGEGRDLAVFVARRGGCAVAIAPFVVERTGLVPRLMRLDRDACEPTPFLYEDERALTAVLAAVADRGLPVVLPRLEADSDDIRRFRALPRRAGLRILRFKVPAGTSVPLDADWSVFEAKMSSKSRTYIRRKRKSAEREGAVSFQAVCPEESSIDRHLGEVFRVEAAGWKGRNGTAILMDARARRFWSAYARAAARLGTLRLFFLRIGDATAAVRMAVERGGRLWELKVGYDERFARHSPGILLTHETLRYACQHGLAAHEFLGVAEPWHRWWPLEMRHYASARSYPLSLLGGAALCEDVWRFGMRGLARTIRAPLRERALGWRTRTLLGTQLACEPAERLITLL
jgi:CelD/BcsL family acetyltransferase involved in cellulose biosynthesis